MDFIKKLITKYRPIILYLFFGGCTTIVNIVSYAVCTRLINIDTIVSTAIAWFLAVLFAYLSNRKYVFHSSVTGIKPVFLEALTFFSCRFTTGLADIGMMWFFVVFLGYNDLLIKIFANVMVTIMNYLASKFFIFKN